MKDRPSAGVNRKDECGDPPCSPSASACHAYFDLSKLAANSMIPPYFGCFSSRALVFAGFDDKKSVHDAILARHLLYLSVEKGYARMWKQLHMVRRDELPGGPPELVVPAGYEVRVCEAGDEDGHVSVMQEVGFVGWNREQLSNWRQLALPGGVFVARHKPTHEIVATAMASHRPTELHPSGGEIGWVAASPRHAGKGLGRTVCTAALFKLLSAGHRCVYLMTDDNRFAAIKTYLRLGFLPFLFAADMEKRWGVVFKRLNWQFDPHSWLRAPDQLWVDR